jgi:hypothetical protein
VAGAHHLVLFLPDSDDRPKATAAPGFTVVPPIWRKKGTVARVAAYVSVSGIASSAWMEV